MNFTLSSNKNDETKVVFPALHLEVDDLFATLDTINVERDLGSFDMGDANLNVVPSKTAHMVSRTAF